jgi:ParB family chromosome partitioning protein
MSSGSKKLFGGLNLSDIAGQVRDQGEGSPTVKSPAQPMLAAAELALKGRTMPALERENILSVDPRRCRPWKYHNRTDAWYTKQRCQDLIESLTKDGQLEPALARKINGDPNFDYELIYGMRRRFAAEFTNSKLKIRVSDADDTKAAVLMHIENADRQDITPMERALSFASQMEANIFATQDALAEAVGYSKAQIAKMLKAAEILKQTTISQLFADKSSVPVEQAYKLAALFERPGAKEVIVQAASNLLRKKDDSRTPSGILKALLTSLDRSQRLEPIRREYNIGASGRMMVSRNPKGKVTFAFSKGLREADREGLLAAIDKVLKDLG